MFLHCVLADDGIKKVTYLKISGEKTHYLGKSGQKLKAAPQLIIFPDFWAKHIRSCPPSELFLFTSLIQCMNAARCPHLLKHESGKKIKEGNASTLVTESFIVSANIPARH